VPNKEYLRLLSEQDKVKIKFQTRNGKVVFFVVQYYALINGKWKTIMRADNCHGFGHLHKYHLQNREFQVSLDQDTAEAFNFAKRHIIENFSKIKENYLLN